MGCDIHMSIEMRGAGGVWTRAEDLVPNTDKYDFPDEEDYRYEEWYTGRSYHDFGILAGVRGTRLPIIEPRGLPADASEYVKKEYELAIDYVHTAHYYTLAEILPFTSRFTIGLAPRSSEVITVVNRMQRLAAEELGGNHDRIRMVFWFDN
jgi:hypothetical protein